MFCLRTKTTIRLFISGILFSSILIEGKNHQQQHNLLLTVVRRCCQPSKFDEDWILAIVQTKKKNSFDRFFCKDFSCASVSTDQPNKVDTLNLSFWIKGPFTKPWRRIIWNRLWDQLTVDPFLFFFCFQLTKMAD